MPRTFHFSLDRRITNWVIKILLKYDLAPEIYYLLTVQGRKSGRPHSIPVVLVEEGGKRYLVAPYGVVDWVKNARAAGQIHLSQRKLDEQFTILELSPQAAAPILQMYLQQFPITGPYFGANLESPLSAFVEDAQTRPVFEQNPIPDR
jgi:deazaflavin-dependent oxidoreductase (nitroreductase family)